MPRLPSVDDLGQRPTPRAYTGKPIVVPNAGAVEEAAAGIGEKIAGFGAQKLEEQDKLQLATHQSDYLTKKIELDTQFAQDTDYATQQKRYGDALSKIKQDISQNIKSSRARAAFEIDTKPDDARAMASIAGRVVAGQRDESRAGLIVTLDNNSRAALAAADPQDSMRLIEESNKALTAAVTTGILSATEAAQQRIAQTEAYAKGRLSLFPDEKQIELLSASMKTEKTGSFLDYLPIDKRKEELDQAKIRLRTDQRQALADQRLAMQGQVDSAEEIGRMLQDHIPVPMDAIDGAIKVAKTAGKDALAYRLGVGKVQSALSSEYASSTPTELQNEVNALDSRIRLAGDKAKPEDVIARDHLEGMRDKTAKALQTDPLSWASGAWGVQIPPLNWDDPASLAQRSKVARQVANRAGVPVKPLTNEEAASFAPIATQGTVSDKLGLITKISRFGAADGSVAARQVAPSDPSFWGMVGLATIPSKSAAASLVTDALAGGDVLKAHPKLIDAQQAQTRFDALTAEALRLLPDTAKGVFANAKSIYGARSGRAGVTDWAHNQQGSPWEGAINGALGAYRDNGVMRGGIGTHAGHGTLLPDGMSQADFDTKIARATAPALMAASNGAPVWSNGKPLYTDELKGMQFVPVANGRYRLSNGTAYVAKKGGGFYELDVTKVR